MKVPTNMIRVLDGQNRDNSDKSIIASIEKEGVLVPLLVYNAPDREDFILVAGHRRLASAIHFGIPEVPVVIIPQDQAERARALENLDRKGLHPLDEASEIRTLQAQGYSNETIGAMLGMDKGKLIRRSKLNNLSEKVRGAFKEGKMDAAAAEEFSIMDPADQDKIYSTYTYRPDAKDIRHDYLNMMGISLLRCTDAILQMEPKCASCPNNIASDGDLFRTTDRSCKDVRCYCEKLRRLASDEKADIYSDSYNKEDRILQQLKKDRVKPVKETSFNVWPSKDSTHTVKMMNFWGKVGYAVPDPPKKKADPGAAARKKEICKEYKALYEEMQPTLGRMLFDHVDAWLAKYHKDERPPDKDERVILAKRLYKSIKWQVDGFIYGKSYYSKQEPLQGSDNRRIFAVMYLYSALDIETSQEIWPHKPEDGDKLSLPRSVEIEDVFNLRKSRARKKVMELKESMESLLKEYYELEKE